MNLSVDGVKLKVCLDACGCIYLCACAHFTYLIFLLFSLFFCVRTQRQHMKMFYIKVTAAKFAFKMIKLKLIFISVRPISQR